MEQTTYNLWNFIVQIMTFVALVIYTIYTVRMYCAIARQSEQLKRQVALSITPSFIAKLEHDFRKIQVIWIKNIGNGYASSITIVDVKGNNNISFIKPKDNKDFLVDLPFDLGILEKMPLYQYRHNNESIYPNNVNFLLENLSDELLEKKQMVKITIRFSDIEGNRYSQNLVLEGLKYRAEKVIKLT